MSFTKKQPLKTERDFAAQSKDADLHGNNAAFICPQCKYVYIVTALGIKEAGGQKSRNCPNPECGKSIAYIKKTRKAPSKKDRAWFAAWIE